MKIHPLNRLIALLLVPCLVIQPGWASAYQNGSVAIGRPHQPTDLAGHFSEEALALAMEGARNSRGHAFRTRQAVGQFLLAPTEEIASTLAQRLSQQMEEVDAK